MWIRARVLTDDGQQTAGREERVFNLDQAKSWRGYGNTVSIDMGHKSYRVDISVTRMEKYTGSSGDFG